MHIMHEKISTSQTPQGERIPSNKKPNVEPYEDDEDLSEPVPRI